MVSLTSFFGVYGVKILLSLIPIVLVTVYFVTNRNKTLKDEEEINKRFHSLNETIAQKNVAKYIKKDVEKNDIISKLNAKMNTLGIENKYENISLVLIVVFFSFAALGNLFIGAGPLLMLYFGCLGLATLYVIIMNKIDKKKKELREEFMQKLRDIAAQMSVGSNFQMAVSESLKSNNTSIAIAREMENVKNEIYRGAKYSDAFMKMYHHLQIKEIKDFAQMCYVYEETGGQFVSIIHAFEDSYKMKRKIIQENDVFEAGMKTDQKIIIGVPALCIVAFSFFSPTAIRGFYSSFMGQIFGIVLITIIYAGSLLMSRFLRFGGNE